MRARLIRALGRFASKKVELIVAKQGEEIRRLNAHVQSAAQQLIQPDRE